MSIKSASGLAFIAAFLFFNPLHCQYQITGKSIMELKKERVSPHTYAYFFTPTLLEVGPQKLPAQLDQYFTLSADAAPKVYQYDELGLFCKFEVQIEKATRFPVKIRLGEVEAVDRKEGKWQFDNWHK